MEGKPTSKTISKPIPQEVSTGFKVFLIWTFVLFGRPQDFLTFLAPFRIALVFTLIALVAAIFGQKRFSFKALLNTGISRKYMVLYLLMILGIPFADHISRAFDWVFMTYIVNVIYFFLAVHYLDSARKIKYTAAALCLSVLFYSVLGLFNGQYVEGRYAIGSMYDPNDLALFMVGLFPIGILFVGKSNSPRMRLMAVAVLAVGPLMTIMSGSRGGLLSLAIVLLTLFMTQVHGIKRSQKIAALALVAATLFIFSKQINIERYTTLLVLEDDYNITSETGRIEVWKSAFKLIAQNPITGVGVRCFPRAFGYLRLAEGRIPEWKAAHNAYIEIWTEVGFPGIIIFLGLILAAVRAYWRMLKADVSRPEQKELKLLSNLLLIGFLGHMVGSFFLSQAYGLQFTLFFALAASIRRLVKVWAEEQEAVDPKLSASEKFKLTAAG